MSDTGRNNLSLILACFAVCHCTILSVYLFASRATPEPGTCRCVAGDIPGTDQGLPETERWVPGEGWIQEAVPGQREADFPRPRLVTAGGERTAETGHSSRALLRFKRTAADNPDVQSGSRPRNRRRHNKRKKMSATHVFANDDGDVLSDRNETMAATIAGEDIVRRWRVADWSTGRNRLNETSGGLVIHDPGIYLIYAQLIFYNAANHNTMAVYITRAPPDGEPPQPSERFIECTQSIDNVNAATDAANGSRYKTCYTSAPALLNVGDVVHIESLYKHRHVYFHKSTSFWGVIKQSV